MLAEPCQRTADEAERFPCSGRGFEDADFALFDAVVDGLHEGLLDLVGLEGVVEVFGLHFFGWRVGVVFGGGVTFILWLLGSKRGGDLLEFLWGFMLSVCLLVVEGEV